MKKITATLRALPASALVLLVMALAAPVSAETSGEAKVPSAAEANNPLAKFKAFNVQNYYIPAISEADGQTANTFWLRYAEPLGKWLVRASLPVPRVPTGAGTTTSGLGDVNVFASYLFDTGNPGVSIGVGPQITAPTASEDATGTGRWQGGLAAIYFNATSKVQQWGGLVTWQADFAGDDARSGTNVLAVQPFYFVQLGDGLYVRGAPVAAFNLEDNSYHVPLGLGIGKVIPADKMVFNVFVEPQFTILSRGAGQPELQFFLGVNMQFVKN